MQQTPMHVKREMCTLMQSTLKFEKEKKIPKRETRPHGTTQLPESNTLFRTPRRRPPTPTNLRDLRETTGGTLPSKILHQKQH